MLSIIQEIRSCRVPSDKYFGLRPGNYFSGHHLVEPCWPGPLMVLGRLARTNKAGLAQIATPSLEAWYLFLSARQPAHDPKLQL